MDPSSTTPQAQFQVMPAMFGLMTLLNPMQAYADQLPLGWDRGGDLLIGTHSPRIALTALIGAVSKGAVNGAKEK